MLVTRALILNRAFLGLSFNKSSERLILFFSAGTTKYQRELEKAQISEVTEPQFSWDKQQQNFFSTASSKALQPYLILPQEVCRASCSKPEQNTAKIVSFVVHQYRSHWASARTLHSKLNKYKKNKQDENTLNLQGLNMSFPVLGDPFPTFWNKANVCRYLQS